MLSVQMQNHLKVLSMVLIAIAAITVPADFPYGAIIAIVFALLGVAGYAMAHYLADPTTAAADINCVLQGMTKAVQDLKTAPVVQQPIDKDQLAVDVLNIMTQLASAKVSASTPTTSTP